ncbi:hypothetical protein [Ekhidna sp.]
MNWKKPLIKIRSFIRGTKIQTDPKKESTSSVIYSFSISYSLVDLRDLKVLILNSPWCLDIPKISIADSAYLIDVAVLSEEKGRLIEAAFNASMNTNE